MGRPKLLDREHVVNVAMCQYWQSGIDTVGMADIARLSGFDRAGIYKEFGGENGLVHEILDNYYEIHVGPRMPIFEACSSAFKAFNLLIDGFIFDNVIKDLSKYGVKDKSLKWPKPSPKARGCVFYGLMISDARASFSGKTKRRIKQLDEMNREWFSNLLTRAKKDGSIQASLSIEEAVDFSMDLMSLLQLMRRQGCSKERMSKTKSMILRTIFSESARSVQH